ncbi:hypothetical protein T439DRAFT_21394 [Meredithblackwellia eburnea MCA 4105]
MAIVSIGQTCFSFRYKNNTIKDYFHKHNHRSDDSAPCHILKFGFEWKDLEAIMVSHVKQLESAGGNRKLTPQLTAVLAHKIFSNKEVCPESIPKPDDDFWTKFSEEFSFEVDPPLLYKRIRGHFNESKARSATSWKEKSLDQILNRSNSV